MGEQSPVMNKDKEQVAQLIEEAQQLLQQVQDLTNLVSKASDPKLFEIVLASKDLLREQIYSKEENYDDLEVSIDKVNFEVSRIKSILSQKTELEKKEKEVLKLITHLFDKIAEKIVGDTEKQAELFERLQEAQQFLAKNKNVENQKEIIIQQAEFEAKRVNAIILRELQIRDEEKALRYLVPGLIIFYIGLIVSIIILGILGREEIWNYTTTIPIIGIPISVMLWAALGSLAAVLYRFYTQEFGKITKEIRWLIARPIIGIIMGCLSYLAILSGLIIFGNNTPSLETSENSKLYVFWIVAFLGGFSDRFFESIINLLAGKFTPKNDAENKKIAKKS